MKEFEHIIYEPVDGRARITLNRPEKRNALSIPLLQELSEALWEADNDTAVHCVILRGAGKAFSAGYDLTPNLNAPASGAGSDRKYRDGGIYADSPAIDDDIWRLEYSQRLRMVIFDMHHRQGGVADRSCHEVGAAGISGAGGGNACGPAR